MYTYTLLYTDQPNTVVISGAWEDVLAKLKADVADGTVVTISGSLPSDSTLLRGANSSSGVTIWAHRMNAEDTFKIRITRNA